MSGGDDDDVNLAALVSGIGGGDPGAVAAALGSGDPDPRMDRLLRAKEIGKKWPEMTRAERLLICDAVEDAFKDLGETLCRQFDEIFVAAEAPIRTGCHIFISYPADPSQDPRLP